MDELAPEGVEERAQLSTADINDLPDSAFAYIEPGGEKDSEGKTTPRSLRHYPVHDKGHADNAAARASAALEGDDADAKAIAQKALPKIKAAQAKFDKQSNSEALVLDPKRATEAIAEAEEALAAGDVPSRNPATPKRAFSSLVEQAPPRTVAVEIRMDEGTDPNIANFAGYAYTIDERYGVTDWIGEYQERIGPGASSKTLKEQRSIPLLLNHDGLPMANTQSKTSQLSDDGHGLRNLALFDRRSGLTNDVCIALARGDIDKMSFSFRAVVDDWNDTYDDRLVRELQLFDTSIVTYPANPGTSAELVEAMRSAMGREGRSLWLAEHELSVRSALPVVVESRELPDEGDDLIEKALRALAHADEVVCRSRGTQHGRARTFLVAGALAELRAGKVLSAKNKALLQGALDALSAADKQHAKLAASHQKAATAVSDALATSDPDANADLDGKSHNTPPGNGNPISPSDGAGPRSLPPSVVQARRDVARLKRGQ